MAIHRSMGEFCTNEEEWLMYVEHLHHYCRAINIVSVCGPLMYKLIKNLVTPRSPFDLSFDLVKEPKTISNCPSF